jgi:hypothetical protein
MKRHAQGGTRWRWFALAFSVAFSLLASAQQQVPANADDAVANPARPTVSTPATLALVGYFQFETGFLAAWHSPEFSSQASFDEVAKFSISRRIEFLAAFITPTFSLPTHW